MRFVRLEVPRYRIQLANPIERVLFSWISFSFHPTSEHVRGATDLQEPLHLKKDLTLEGEEMLTTMSSPCALEHASENENVTPKFLSVESALCF